MQVKHQKHCPHCTLSFAILDGDLEQVQKLIASEIDLNEQVICNDALAYAIRENNIELVRLLITKGADPNLAISHNRHPLIQAIEDQNRAMITQLIALGATLNTISMADFISPSDSPEFVSFLLSIGTDINSTNQKTGRNALHVAAMYGYSDTCQLLLDQQINHQLQDKFGNTAVELAKRNGYLQLAELISDWNN